MMFYHRTPKLYLNSILADGLRPGSEVRHGERLPFIMFDKNPHQVTTGHVAYLAVEIDENDPKLHWVNEEWIEYRGRVPVEAIMAVANPPSDNGTAIRHLLEDDDSPWQYQPTR